MRFLTILFLVFTTHASAQNHLAGEASLYLQQHADNPVNWYPWGKEALQKARDEDKMIFVSVGYASCHWCHVMAEESFENKAIANLLNTNFINIKIDRERRPDLDEQFSLVTTALTGSSGWPNSVFLTPDAEPFYAGTYFPPDTFTQIVNTVTDIWETDRPALIAEAFAIASRLRDYLDQTAVLGSFPPEEFHKTAVQLIRDLDEFNGGFGSAPKFPREPEMLYLLDQALRHGDDDLMNAVTTTLDGMLRGGIHDHLGGGFHRYSVDPEWHVPHFEKMLYNQALIGRLLLRSYNATGNPDYARAATRTFDYVLRDMRAPLGGFFGSEDADSLNVKNEREEGIYYSWTPKQMAQALGDNAQPLIQTFDVVENGSFEGANVLHMQELPLIAAKDAGLNAADFDSQLETLRLTRNKRIAPIKDQKIILAWNGEMIATLAEASLVLNRPDYLQAAETAAEFILSHMWPETGLKRIWFDNRTDGAAQLLDYGALGHAFVALHDYSQGDGTRWLKPAQRLADTMLARFGDADQAMRMTAESTGLGPFRPLDDTEINSGNALALALLDGLDRRFARIGEDAPRLAAALAIDALNRPASRAGILHAMAVQQQGPTAPMRTSNGGAVRVFATLDREKGQLELQFRLADGWHVNAHNPLEDYLIGMELSLDDTPAPQNSYPKAQIKELGFSATPLALYEQDFAQIIPFEPAGNGATRARLTLQACNEEVCLPPDEMVFWFW
ncbi:MAG: DUF255 domain-containing protein [Rhodobacteraceae bacterium]|nr:DUF255 domain-containing protein [Paracoccaceae bacterium]